MRRFDVVCLAAGLVLCALIAWNRYEVFELHGDRLLPDEVPVRYGLGAGDGIPYDVSSHQFPNAHLYTLGGCIVGPDSPTHAKVRACSSCRRVRRTWLLEHNWPDHPHLPKPGGQ